MVYNEVKCKYVLTKLSSSWFDLYTDSIETVLYHLELHICKSCMIKDDGKDEFAFGIPMNYDELEPYDKVMSLLSTSCGAEFMLEEDGVPPQYEVVEE